MNVILLKISSGYLTVQLTDSTRQRTNESSFLLALSRKNRRRSESYEVYLYYRINVAPEYIKGETIYFGSPRLHQIFESTKNLARYIRLYEEITPIQQQTPLLPWICLNVKISYQCDRKRDLFKSIGLQLN